MGGGGVGGGGGGRDGVSDDEDDDDEALVDLALEEMLEAAGPGSGSDNFGVHDDYVG
jgi:hypothetical protein